jgi:hypothetical protein
VDCASAIAQLEREWDFDTGFFGRLRNGSIDSASLHRLLRALEIVDLGTTATVDRRLVSLLWYMPFFLWWQRERILESGGDVQELDLATNQIHAQVERILGVP